MNTIGSGMELLREQDFSSRLSQVGQYEADRIVNIFNRMMEQLKNERLRMREQNHFLDLLIQASPMGVIILTMDDEVSQLNPMAVKMLGVRMEEALAKRLDQMDSPLAAELSAIPKDETAVLRLNDANIYKCTHSTFIDRGFKHPFFLIERMTEEVMRAEKRAYEKVIRMIAHEVNNTTAGITSTLDTVEQALSTEDDMEDICDRVCMQNSGKTAHEYGMVLLKTLKLLSSESEVGPPAVTYVGEREFADMKRRMGEIASSVHTKKGYAQA